MNEEPDEQYGHRRMSSLDAAELDEHDPKLIAVKQQPFNAEAPLVALRESHTPTPLFYVRSNFPLPDAPVENWQITIGDAVHNPLALSLDELRAMPSRTVSTTMECAGNDRNGFVPKAEGETWALGAISTGTWRGVALADVLNRAGLRDSAVEILFEGADSGPREGVPVPIPFARSLPLDKALHPDTLLVYEMNGAPLPHEHGGPLRLIVPGWYGMASVKWLARISAIETPFAGHFQWDRYILQYPGDEKRLPLREMFVKSLLTSPAPGATFDSGQQEISGIAWSGNAQIVTVELRIGADGAWQQAELLGESSQYTWRQWRFAWQPTEAGSHTIRLRATDEAGNNQPNLSAWNRLGYANNAIQEIVVHVSDNR